MSWASRFLGYVLTATWPEAIVGMAIFVGVLPFVVWRVLVRWCSVSPFPVSVFVMVSCAGRMYPPIFAAYEEFGQGRDENRNSVRYPHELLAWDLRFKSNRTIEEFVDVALKLRTPPMSADVSDSAAAPVQPLVQCLVQCQAQARHDPSGTPQLAWLWSVSGLSRAMARDNPL